WGSGQSRRLTMHDSSPIPILVAPRVPDPDGIAAVRGLLGVSYFDETRCRRGLARLRGYKKSKMGTPVHDDASHGSDAMKTAATGMPLITSISGRYSMT